MISPATRIGQIKEYYFSSKLREIDALNTAGQDIINLGIGSPDLPPADKVIDQLKATAAGKDSHGYQSYKGSPELRAAMAAWYQKCYHVNLDPSTEILPLLGSKEGIMHISMTYLEEGDEVLIPDPGYPAYKACTELAGAKCTFYDLSAANDWQPDLAALEKTNLSRVKIMWVNYPHMPTGANAQEGLFKKLLDFGEKHAILICHDNPYSFILTETPTSILQVGMSDYLLELNSLSKSHNMAGWRVGMISANKQHIENLLKFKSNMDSGMFKPVQLAAIAALNLTDSWYEAQNKHYSSRKEIALQIMKALNCKVQDQQSGLFVWGEIPQEISNLTNWTDRILQEAHVFVVPGSIFGENGQRYIRISLCANEARLSEALIRIKNWN